MANTVSSRTLCDNAKEAELLIYLASDGASGELTDQAIVTASSLNPAASKLTIEDIEYTFIGFDGFLEFDATTDVPFAVLAGGVGPSKIKFCRVRGLKDNSGSGTTGNILLTTSGFSDSGDRGTIKIRVRKD